MSISDIRQEHVRAWRAAELKNGPKHHPPFGPVTVAKAYRLLRAILSTAVTGKRIRENPCQIKRAARIYLHTREEREQQLAATLDRMARRELKASVAKRTPRRSGTRPAIRLPAKRGRAR